MSKAKKKTEMKWIILGLHVALVVLTSLEG